MKKKPLSNQVNTFTTIAITALVGAFFLYRGRKIQGFQDANKGIPRRYEKLTGPNRFVFGWLNDAYLTGYQEGSHLSAPRTDLDG